MPLVYSNGCQLFPGASFQRRDNPAEHCESRRLATFSGWPHNHPCFAIRLAKNGFVYRGHGDLVECWFCGFSKKDWGKDESPEHVHLAESPNCPMTRAETADTTAVSSINDGRATKGAENSETRNNRRRDVVHSVPREELSAAGSLFSRGSADASFSAGRLRLRPNVPIPTLGIRNDNQGPCPPQAQPPAASRVASPIDARSADGANESLDGDSDDSAVIDIYAERVKREMGVKVRGTRQQKRAEILILLGHLPHPQEERRGLDAALSPSQHEEDGAQTRSGRGEEDREAVEPWFPMYRSEKKRLESYEWDFPTELRCLVRGLCSAGFFYMGCDDIVMCWKCGLMLHQWNPTDDPVHSHVTRQALNHLGIDGSHPISWRF